jgi:hypothetical protein
VVQGVANVLADCRLARDAGKLLLEPGLERQHERLAALLADGTALIGTVACDRLLDGIEGGDARKRLAGAKFWTDRPKMKVHPRHQKASTGRFRWR